VREETSGGPPLNQPAAQPKLRPERPLTALWRRRYPNCRAPATSTVTSASGHAHADGRVYCHFHAA
jgi:hypothetical protein